MRFRGLVAISGLLALGAIPFATAANGPGKAADACIQALVDNYVPKNRTVQVRKNSPTRISYGVYARRYDFDLSARVNGNGAPLVTAHCVASADGRVISLES